VVEESGSSGAANPCAAATEGDTHLATFNGGLLYDFQATGDFLLAQTQNFTVQARQVSGAPTWPNASLNQAVATQMGNTRVALCATTPAPLVVDGAPTALPDGQTLALSSGVDVLRTGNVYFVTDLNGNSLRAVVHNTTNAAGVLTAWIDASVDLGTWPTQVSGLLANPSGKVNELEASDGTVYSMPVSSADLYEHYGKSWRVAPADSLLAYCGGAAKENTNPKTSFFARDLLKLNPMLYAHARETCESAGVAVPALLDACTLDVAVLGTKEAAQVYVSESAPAAVGDAGQATSG